MIVARLAVRGLLQSSRAFGSAITLPWARSDAWTLKLAARENALRVGALYTQQRNLFSHHDFQAHCTLRSTGCTL